MVNSSSIIELGLIQIDVHIRHTYDKVNRKKSPNPLREQMLLILGAVGPGRANTCVLPLVVAKLVVGPSSPRARGGTARQTKMVGMARRGACDLQRTQSWWAWRWPLNQPANQPRSPECPGRERGRVFWESVYGWSRYFDSLACGTAAIFCSWVLSVSSLA